jgi:hypothetical protein
MAIARLKSNNPIDASLLMNNPNLQALSAFLGKTLDPATRDAAIQSLQVERDYVAGFAPSSNKKPLSSTGDKAWKKFLPKPE